jgi:DNA primase catalytic subunit
MIFSIELDAEKIARGIRETTSDAMIAKIKNVTDEDLVKMALSHFINGRTGLAYGSKMADNLIVHFPRRIDELIGIKI